MLIEFFADLICPWCYIGWHRVLRAVAERPRRAVDIRWQPFQLNPDMPPSGMERQLYLQAKFGSRERARQIYGVVEETARRDGIAIDLGRITRTPNTLDAHRLIRLAERDGPPHALIGALFERYFREGRDLSDRDVLAATAADVGMDPDRVREALAGDGELASVRATDMIARQLGLHAVPCMVIDRRYALSGAQEPASILPLLDLGAPSANASRVA